MSLASQAHADRIVELTEKPPLWRGKPFILRKEFIAKGHFVHFEGPYQGSERKCPAYISRVSNPDITPGIFSIILLDHFTEICHISTEPYTDDIIRPCLRATTRENARNYVETRLNALQRQSSSSYESYLEQAEQLGIA